LRTGARGGARSARSRVAGLVVLSSSQLLAAEGIHFNKQEKNFHFKKIYEKKLKNFKIKFNIKNQYKVNKSLNIN